MRYIGILMMAGALAAGGFWAADQWKEKLELLLLFRQMMFYLKGQILYANATLPEALREVGGRYAEGRSGFLKEPGAFFLRVAERLEEQGDVPFPVIWKEEAERFPPGFPLRQGTIKISWPWERIWATPIRTCRSGPFCFIWRRRTAPSGF